MTFTSHNAYEAHYLTAYRAAKKAERENRIARRQDISGRSENLLNELQLHFLRDDDLRIYINKTQVNVDFCQGATDKFYLTCSRRHDRIRVDLLIRDLLPSHNKTVFAWFDVKFGLKAKDASGRRRKDTMMRFMMDAKDVAKFIETIKYEFRPIFADRPKCFEELKV